MPETKRKVVCKKCHCIMQDCEPLTTLGEFWHIDGKPTYRVTFNVLGQSEHKRLSNKAQITVEVRIRSDLDPEEEAFEAANHLFDCGRRPLGDFVPCGGHYLYELQRKPVSVKKISKKDCPHGGKNFTIESPEVEPFMPKGTRRAIKRARRRTA